MAGKDVMTLIEGDVRAHNELFGLLMDEQLNRDAMVAQLQKCSEYTDVLRTSVSGDEGQLAARLVGLIQLQNHVVRQLVDRLGSAPSDHRREGSREEVSRGTSLPQTVPATVPSNARDAVKTRLPHISNDLVDKALEATNCDIDQATEMLMLPRHEFLSDATLQQISSDSLESWMVKQVFPDVPDGTVTSALANTDNDPDAAINLLLVQGAAWASAAPVQQLATITQSKTMTRTPGRHELLSVMQEMIPDVPPDDIDSALRSSRGNVWRAFKLLREQRRSKTEGPNRMRKDKETSNPVRRQSDPGRIPSQSQPPSVVRFSRSHFEIQQQVAQKLALANVAPEDFFKLNSRLMISTKRRVSQVISSAGLPAREAQIVVGKERLRERLSCLGLKEVAIRDDGNCQFRAFAFQLCRSSEQHWAIRQSIVYYMRNHRQLYSMYFDGDADFDRYLTRMAQDREWGDEMTLKGFCDCYNATVHLVMSTGTRWYHQIKPEHPKEDGWHVAISYLSPVHYNAIVPQEYKLNNGASP